MKTTSINLRMGLLAAGLLICTGLQAGDPPYARSEKGYWVVESNVKKKTGAVVRYYTASHKLLKEDHLKASGLKLSLRNKKRLDIYLACYAAAEEKLVAEK